MASKSISFIASLKSATVIAFCDADIFCSQNKFRCWTSSESLITINRGWSRVTRG